MKARYHLAAISFCTNLTKSDSETIPVGILMLAELPGHAMALLVVREDHALLAKLPPLIGSIMKDFPTMLKAQLEEILAGDEDGSIDNVMNMFEDSLRNSFFVSHLRSNQEVEIEVRKLSKGTSPQVNLDPWRDAYPTCVKTVSEGMMEARVDPDEVRQHFRPWIHPVGNSKTTTPYSNSKHATG